MKVYIYQKQKTILQCVAYTDVFSNNISDIVGNIFSGDIVILDDNYNSDIITTPTYILKNDTFYKILSNGHEQCTRKDLERTYNNIIDYVEPDDNEDNDDNSFFIAW